MKTRTFRRMAATLSTATLLGTALAMPTAATAAPVHGEDIVAETCQIEDATLGWGMKESFRTYITGSIANGSWETGEGVRYVDPALSDTGAIEPGTDLFEWSRAGGEVANTLEGGTASFVGSIHFTGHDGALTLNIGDPAIEFVDSETAYLLLAIGEAEAGAEVPQVKAAKIELGGALESGGTHLAIAGASVILTAEGAEAFNGGRGSYASGVEMDPIFLNATVSGCEFGAVVAEEPAAAEPEIEEEVVTQEEEQSIPWLPIVLGGVALVVIAVAVTLLITGRPKKQGATGGSDSDGEKDPNA